MKTLRYQSEAVGSLFVELPYTYSTATIVVLRQRSAAGSVIRWIYVLSWIAPRHNQR